MKKILSIVLITTIFFSLFNKVDVYAQESTDTEVTQEVFTVGMALPFQMLEAYLYALTGQQAVDTYYNNEEQEKELHEDFCNFLGNTSTGIQMNMQINKALATVTMDKMMEYYKTEGSSALSGASEKARENFKVIVGGGNSDNNDNDDNDPEYDEAVRLMSSSSSALVTVVAKYIDELVNGKRGNVSKTFASGGEVPELYFDGDYNIVDNDLYFEYCGYWKLDSYYAGQYRLNGLVKMYVNDIATNGNTRFALLLNTADYFDQGFYNLWTYEEEIKLYSPWFYYKDNAGVIQKGELKVFSDLGDGAGYYAYGYQHPYFDTNSIAQFNAIPVFNTEALLKHYIETGDASGALNLFEVPDNKPGWYSFPFSAISSKLNKLLQPFNTLPLITTESLTGFAQGVNNSAVAGALPSANPEQQQSRLEKLLEDNAKRAVTEQLADNAVTKTENELAEEYGATPQPTLTPEQNVVVTQSQIMVDLHNFFPFCVPYDLVHLIKALNAPPVAPCFETAIVYQPLGIDVPIKLDLSGFEGVAKVFRVTEVILFILALILVSRSLIRG